MTAVTPRPPSRSSDSRTAKLSEIQQLRLRRASPLPDRRDAYDELRAKVVTRLSEEIGNRLSPLTPGDNQSHLLIQEQLESVLLAENVILRREERRRLLQDVCDEMLGLGPIEPLMRAEDVTEIMVDSASEVFVRRQGQMERVSVRFDDDAHLNRIANRIIAMTGPGATNDPFILDARLPDGSFANVIMPPLATNGPTLFIRPLRRNNFTLKQLCQANVLSEAVADFLFTGVKSRLNIIISGQAQSGKEALLSALIKAIGADERLILIEEFPTLEVSHEHLIVMRTGNLSLPSGQPLTQERVIDTAVKMRPDRLVVDELTPEAVYALLKSLTNSQTRAMTTLVAESAQQMIEILCRQPVLSANQLAAGAARELICSSVDLIVQMDDDSASQQRILSIHKVVIGTEGQIVLAELFHVDRRGAFDDKDPIIKKNSFRAS